jgi:hypothetical protein
VSIGRLRACVVGDTDGERDYCSCAGDATTGDPGVRGHLRRRSAVERRSVVAGRGDHLRRRCSAVPPANVPAAAGGWTLVRHQQLEWWMSTAPMIYERSWLGQKIGGEPTKQSLSMMASCVICCFHVREGNVN